MSYKLLSIMCLLFTLNIFAAEQSVEVLVKRTDAITVAPKAQLSELFILGGIQQAVTKELVEKKLDDDEFWKKIEEKKLSDVGEVNFFSLVFISKQVNVNENTINPGRPGTLENPVITEKTPPADPFIRASFTYEINSEKLKKLYEDTMSSINLPDVSIKTFYILPDIGIDSEMSWDDVGVSKKENFSGVIVESWKKWAMTSFKGFTNIVVLEKDFSDKSENINSESVILKWNSVLKKAEVFQDRKSARFEMTAQYVLMNTKSGESLTAFDFPNQKREYNIANAKQLSSNLASLIYNLLNSQTKKISSALELNLASSTFTTTEFKVSGKAGLLDISQVNSILAERFKQITLVSETKSYSGDLSVISIKSTAGIDSLYALFAKDGGKFPLNEQKLLVFNPQNRSFAIISK
ncbi:MAG: hypothetical protein H7336_01645 [Bacteriovorax sp.]|nr:hypothetical protein [Bacteriovorax sp.]